MTNVVPIEPCEKCAPLVAELRASNAELQARGLEKQAQLDALTQRVKLLEERLGLNSTNSHKPPSSDGPSVHKPKKSPSGRKQGAQPGHPGKARELVPAERIDEVVELRPARCEACQSPLAGPAESVRVHQVTELPPMRAHVTEYRLQSLCCGRCRHKTEAALPEGVPQGAFGPQLQATVSYLGAEMRISKRKTEQAVEDLFDVPISTGSVVTLQQAMSQTLREPVEEVRTFVRQAEEAKNVDETGWKMGSARAWLWVVVCGPVAYFIVQLSRGSKVARDLLGSFVRGTLISDRYSAYSWVNLWSRQLCWAHLLRDFKAAAERVGPAAPIAEGLEKAARAMLRQWKRVRDGDIDRSTFKTCYAVRFRARIHELLEQGRSCEDPKLSGLCKTLLARESALWTFVRIEGVEPTSNAAERALRHAVLWRRSSQRSQTRAGADFVGRMLTVITSLRMQRRNVLQYLTAAAHASMLALPAPSLLPQALRQVAQPVAARA
jgi:transposase